MSFQAMSDAIKARMPATEKLVFLLMANYADDKNICWPSYTTLADEAGVSERTIARIVDRLS
ncbi:helix-turn-helix domain-containing protein, partial [Photobacterium sp. OFAV2-7]|uniref:helix-turn-helix domain-containing protein n=1 Tax=Photobacterium sp. OFAV2-7 TaxID=2917748 RepID=UPI001EF537A2